MVIRSFGPVHVLAGMAWATFFGGLWLIMLGLTTWATAWAPMLVSIVLALPISIVASIDWSRQT